MLSFGAENKKNQINELHATCHLFSLLFFFFFGSPWLREVLRDSVLCCFFRGEKQEPIVGSWCKRGNTTWIINDVTLS